MKYRLLLLIVTVYTISCNKTEPKKEPEEITPLNNAVSESNGNLSDTLGPSPNQVAPTEYIEWNNIKINNLLRLSTNIGQINAVFGKADSTITPDYENTCNNCHFCSEEIPPYKDAYFKGLEFEQLNDSLVFWSADFTKNKSLFLQNGNMRFDCNTTLAAVNKIFPEAVREKRVEESHTWVRISPSKQPADGSFILEFNNDGYLTKFHYWFPC